MLAEFQSAPFDPADARTALKQLPERSAVFALYGEAANAEPYIGRTPNLRGRLERLLLPSPRHPKRLQLAGRVRRIEWRLTGSDFESLLLQFELLERVFGPKALERMHLAAPSFVRFLGSNRYPRVVVTNRPSRREADWTYGPFASRAAAERFAEETLKLFLLRRCVEDLDPNPSHPGCVYSEMKMCLAPCYQGCTDERYAEEAAGVERFLATRGESKLVQLRAERAEASANLEFEQAAAAHAQVLKAEAVRALAPELVRPLSQLRAIVLQPQPSPARWPFFSTRMAACGGRPLFRPSACGSRTSSRDPPRCLRNPLRLKQFPRSLRLRPGSRRVRQPEGSTRHSAPATSMPRAQFAACLRRGSKRCLRSSRQPARPRMRRSGRGIWRCSSGGFTGRRRGGRARSSSPRRTVVGLSGPSCAGLAGWRRRAWRRPKFMKAKVDLRAELAVGRNALDPGRVPEIAEWIGELPRRIPRLIELIWDDDPGVASRAADVLERISRWASPALLRAIAEFKEPLIGLLAESGLPKVRWNLALTLPRLKLTVPECRRMAETLSGYLDNRSSIVKTAALHGLADLTRQDESLRAGVVDLLRMAERTGTPAMRARSRILLKAMERAGRKEVRRSSLHMFD